VGAAVRSAHAEGLRGVDLDGERLDAAAEQYGGRRLGLDGTDLTQVLDPRHIVETRTAAGGAAPPVVEAMAHDCAAQALELRATARARGAAFAGSRRVLVDAASAVVAATTSTGGRT
jgi:argininosuccinate lyase